MTESFFGIFLSTVVVLAIILIFLIKEFNNIK
jgi:hypothetical protein